MSAGVAPAPVMIEAGEFALFQSLVRREAGISLGPHKKALLMSRLLPRMNALGVRTFGEYFHRVTAPGGEQERVRMVDCICTNETSFFREPSQFDFIEHEVIPAWVAAGPRRIRVWSAACSTGEEPYSLAMALRSGLPLHKGFTVEILATDLSTRALDRAMRGIWPLEKAAQIPAPYLHAHMLKGKGAQQGTMKAGPEIRAMVTFYRMNLNDGVYSIPGKFDLILCRNVLIYFDAATRARVTERILERLLAPGYLFLGHAEALRGVTQRLDSVTPAGYRLRKG